MNTVPEIASREQLRAFLRLNGRMTVDGVSEQDVKRQEDTVLRALAMLREQPGVVLADEVGMGKTFEALGVAAAFHHTLPQSRIIVLTPGSALNSQWEGTIAKFSDRAEHDQRLSLYNFSDGVCAAEDLAGLLECLRAGARLVVVPVTAFLGARARDSQQYLLGLYFIWKDLHGQSANAILRRFRDGELKRIDPRQKRFLGVVPYAEVEPHLDAVFGHPARKKEPKGLDDLYRELGHAAFENQKAVQRALDQARFRLVRELMPELSLLILDEAHKLKNAHTVRTRAFRTAFRCRFHKALFLTATPFQLDIGELRQVFELFGSAEGAPASIEEQAAALFADIREYKAAYDDLERAWAGLDPGAAAHLGAHLDARAELIGDLDDSSLAAVYRRFCTLVALKEERVEPGLRRWMIRSLREDKRVYRNREKPPLAARGPGALPFFLYERLIAELFRVGSPTHKTAVQINMVSSYAAARAGTLLLREERTRDLPTVEAYRRLLVDVLDRFSGHASHHPKVDHVASQALAAAERGEKTLIFCARVDTLHELTAELAAAWEARLLGRWKALYPDAGKEDIFDRRDDGEHVKKGKHAVLQQRFHGGQDPLYLALREHYVQDLLHLQDWPLAHLDAITEEANRILQTVEAGQTAATRIDYKLAKRCVEQATARLCERLAPPQASGHEEALARLCDPRFVAHGYGLEPERQEGDEARRHRPSWRIRREVAELVVQPRRHLWGELGHCLAGMPGSARASVVEGLAHYLTVRQVPFLIEVLEVATAQGMSINPTKSHTLLELIDRYWLTPRGQQWIGQFATFLTHYASVPERLQRGLLAAIDRAAFARHTDEAESRDKLREAFNTPLFPMVLIANEIMQEGLDLHRSCRRVVHHDLAWNPAQLEQRVGRVDRLGSLTARLRAKDPSVTLDILYPLIKNTIDDRLYRAVHAREKWLEFLLGAKPDFKEYWLGEELPPPLPDSMAARLRIDLGPR